MRDWKNAYGPPPVGFAAAVERALQEKEERRMVHGRKKWAIVLIVALMAALLAGMAYAAVQLGLLDIRRSWGLSPAEGAEEIIVRDLGTTTKAGVTMTVTEAAYTGNMLDLVLTFVGDFADPNTAEIELFAPGAEFGGKACMDETDSELLTIWVSALLDGDAPERLDLSVSAWETLSVSFAIDRAPADELTPISGPVESTDGALTLCEMKIDRSLLSQAVFLSYQCNSPRSDFDYMLELLDADGAPLRTLHDIAYSATLPDGTNVYKMGTILDRDARIVAMRIYSDDGDERFGYLPIPEN